MTAHQIHIAACVGTDRLGVWCSCDPKKLLLHGKPGGVYGLAGLNDVADEHIRGAESESPFVEMLVSGSYQTIADVPPEGYGTKSAITSEDELVDIETGLRRAYDPMLLPRGLHGPL